MLWNPKRPAPNQSSPMADLNTVLTRMDLLNLVWAKPTTQITKEYGVKLVAVLKACEALGIPRPTTGHWSKVPFGKAPPTPALPSPSPGMPESTTFAEWGSRKWNRRPKEVQAPSGEAKPALPEPEPEVVKWHDAVRRTRTAYRGGGKHHKYGTVLSKSGHPCLWLSVTPEHLDRGLRLMNRFAWILEEHGFKFADPEEGKDAIRLVYVSSETEVGFSITEQVERYPRELKPEEKGRSYIYDQWRYRPTGRLRLMISEYYPHGARKSWGDGKNTKLDDKLADAVPEFEACAKAIYAHELETKEWHRRYEEDQRRREQAEAQKRKEAERKAAFVAAAANWSAAQQLRNFREVCEKRFRGQKHDRSLTKAQDDWLKWVDEVISGSDPLTAGFLEPLEKLQT